MWELIMLAVIAMRTGKYNIVDIMTRGELSARNGNCMVKLIDVRPILALLQLIEAIIASIALSFQFHLNLLYRKLPFKIILTGAPDCGIHSAPRTFLGQMSLVVLSLSCQFLFLVGLAILSASCTLFSPVLCIVSSTACAFLFTVGFSVLFLPCAFRFQMNLTESPTSYTRSFSVLLLILPVLFNMSIVIDFSVCSSASFATRIQSTSGVFIEELRGSRKELLAFGALFLRGILGYHAHDRAYSLSGSDCLQQCGASSCFLHYTISPLVKLVQEAQSIAVLIVVQETLCNANWNE